MKASTTSTGEKRTSKGFGARGRAWVWALALALTCLVGCASVRAEARERDERPIVQLAILLDTSNSMDGLIAQAKAELWKVVNELARARRRGQRPRLEVALYEYGNNSIPASAGYVRRVLGFTTDLDRVSEALFGLTTNGGDEYCGQVIDVARHELGWSRDRGVYRVMFVAGNEPFTQGPIDYRTAVPRAIRDGIVVNTIHCGRYDEGVQGKWLDAARLADGSYLAIDQDRQVPQFAAPQDDEIRRLNTRLNETYVGYGAQGRAAKARQHKQDAAAASLGGGVAAERSVAKAVAAAPAAEAQWDLVSAQSTGTLSAADVDEEALPEEMRGMDKAEREAHVEKLARDRAEIQAQIGKLAEERRAYVSEKEKEFAREGADTLGAAMIKAIHGQAEKVGFGFEE